MATHIGTIEHPKHGTYYVYFDQLTDSYGISKEWKGQQPGLMFHCAYASLAAVFQAAGL